MASIMQRKQADGTVRYTAQIRLRIDGEAYQQSRTFATKAAAASWAKKREEALKSGDAPISVSRVKIRKLIEDYLAEKGGNIGPSKRKHLTLLTTFAMADLDAIALTPAQLVEHVSARRASGTGPSTVINDLVWLRVVWRYAGLQRIAVKMATLDEAMAYCKADGLIARARRRVRRPTSEELKKIGEWFRYREGRGAPPMYDIMWAAIYSCRRLDELCRMRLSDWDRERGVWLIRDVKHPSGSTGHHMEMTVTERLKPVIAALETKIQRPTGDDRLIHWKSSSVGNYWGKQLRLLGVDDLRFHDLRHEGCSRLAEDGWTIPQIQRVSLHESWASLQRYVHVPSRTSARCEYEPQNSV